MKFLNGALWREFHDTIAQAGRLLGATFHDAPDPVEITVDPTTRDLELSTNEPSAI
jgi:hypothetical protein